MRIDFDHNMGKEQHRESSLPPEVYGHISQMEESMIHGEFNHAGTPSQLAIDLWKDGKISSFAQFEEALRHVDSRVYSFAVPLDYFGKQTKTIYPVNKGNEIPKYTLYFAVNGKNEAIQMRKKLGVTIAENQRRLKQTGILTISLF